MEHMYLILANQAVMLAIILLIVNMIAEYLTEWREPVVDLKPFNCRPCMSFWLVFWVLLPTFHYGYRASGDLSLAAAVSVAFLNFFIIRAKYDIY